MPFARFTSYLAGVASTLLLSQSSASDSCLIGWPAVLGSVAKDGNTDVMAWSETPFTDNYLIGGNSDSLAFTEHEECSTNGKGCAYITNWNKVSQEFTQKWIFTEADTLLEIVFEPYEDERDEPKFAAIFSKTFDDGTAHQMVTFNKWQERRREAIFSGQAYILNEPYNSEGFNPFDTTSIFVANRFGIINNAPSEVQSIEYVFELDDDGKVLSVHSDDLNTANNGNIFLGTPTMKHTQNFGYGIDNIIQLATVTVPRSEKELGGPTMLFEAQTYSVVISRSISDAVTLLIRHINEVIEDEGCSESFSKIDLINLHDKMCSDSAFVTDFLVDLQAIIENRCSDTTFDTAFWDDMTDYYNRMCVDPDFGTPFTYIDRLYVTREESDTEYYYYDQVAVSYTENAAGRKTSDAVLHTIGQHSTRKNEVLASAWIIEEDHELDHQETVLLNMGEDVRVIGVEVPDTDNLYQIYISYVELQDESQIGKVLVLDMLELTGAYSFEFMPSQAAANFEMLGFVKQGENFLYGGRTNLYESFGTTSQAITVDWTDNENYFGFFDAYSSADQCTTEQQRTLQGFGKSITTDFDDANIQRVDWRIYFEEEASKVPPNDIAIGDLDSEDYARDLYQQEQATLEGFKIETTNWRRLYETDEDGEYYPIYMFEIDGDLWIQVFHSSGEETNYLKHETHPSQNILGVTGLINSIFIVWLWIAHLGGQTNSEFWFSMLGPFVVNGLLWTPLTLIWPAGAYGGPTFINLLTTLARSTLVGPFGAYWLNLAALWYTSINNATDSGSTFADTSEAWQYIGMYAALSVFNSAISLVFVPQLVEFNEQLFFEEEIIEETEEEEEVADGGVFFFDSTGEVDE